MKKRREAFLVKDADPMAILLNTIIPRRYDATNSAYLDIKCQPLDDFIRKMRDEEGVRYTYRDILIAALVRVLTTRPRINRFIMNGRIYERYKVTMCFMVKAALSDDAEEVPVKVDFNGNETLPEIREIIQNEITKNLKTTEDNKTGQKADSLGSMPVWVMKLVVGLMRFLDKHNRLPKSFFDASPFHNSCFITDLKSIKTGPIIHHCYDFGTVGLFIALGKEEWQAIVDDDRNIVPAKIVRLGINTDERLCDGLYWAKSFHLIRKFLNDPTLLFEPYTDEKVQRELEKDRIVREKALKKAAKRRK